MREIKFRVWIPYKGEWTHEVTFFATGGWEARLGIEGYNTNDGVEVMQFTGLLDVNGKELYEGDVVKNVTHAFNGVVFFENGSFWVREYKTHTDEGLYDDREKETRWSINLDWEIIGNMYEDPELLHERQI